MTDPTATHPIMTDPTSTDRAVVGALLTTEPAPPPGLRDRLAGAAGAADLLDVAYATLDTRIGPLLVAATPAGLVRIAFGDDDHDRVLADLAERVSPRVLHAPARLAEVARQLDEYLAGRRRDFDLPVDLRLAKGFRRDALDRLRLVPYGHTVTYAGLAAATGRPTAVRAAGSACATNPVPLVVPCHRVVRSDGTIGNYGGGTIVKERLLALEATGAPIPA